MDVRKSLRNALLVQLIRRICRHFELIGALSFWPLAKLDFPLLVTHSKIVLSLLLQMFLDKGLINWRPVWRVSNLSLAFAFIGGFCRAEREIGLNSTNFLCYFLFLYVLLDLLLALCSPFKRVLGGGFRENFLATGQVRFSKFIQKLDSFSRTVVDSANAGLFEFCLRSCLRIELVLEPQGEITFGQIFTSLGHLRVPLLFVCVYFCGITHGPLIWISVSELKVGLFDFFGLVGPLLFCNVLACFTDRFVPLCLMVGELFLGEHRGVNRNSLGLTLTIGLLRGCLLNIAERCWFTSLLDIESWLCHLV